MLDEKINLIKFLNKFVKPQIEGLDEIVDAYEFKEIPDFYGHPWTVEVETIGLDECNSFKLILELQKYISVYGANCDVVSVKCLSRIYN